MAKHAWPIITLFVLTLFLFLPILINPNIFLTRDNDLTKFFWPIYYFVKESIFNHRQLPFWFPNILSGTPLLPDPQSGIFYPPNIIFIFLPIDLAFVVSSFLHVLAGGLAMYILAKQGLGLKRFSSLFAASLYVAIPKLSAAMEAGHFGIIQAHAWLPLVALATLQASPILLAISLSGLFFTHPTTFMYASISTALFFLSQKINSKRIVSFGIGAVLTFGLIAIAFLPQLEWLPQTNRQSLFESPQTYPIWNSKIEFIKAVFVEKSLETEKAIILGIIPSTLATIGFLGLTARNKTKILIGALVVVLISLNNASPIYDLLLTQKSFVAGRVATRIWFVMILTTILLAAYGFERLKVFKKTIFVLAVFELLFISWSTLGKPIADSNEYAGQEIYEFLGKDTDIFRIFCTNRCIAQKEAVKHNLELIEGYSTLISESYISRAWQLTGIYWNHYTLALPPLGYEDKVTPDAVALGEQNVKYIISPKKIIDKNLELKLTSNKYLVYLNKAFLSRTNGKITFYSPNKIVVDTKELKSNSLWLSEVYSPGWTAYLNGKERVGVLETPIHQRSINIKPDTRFVELKYRPQTFTAGLAITTATVLAILYQTIIKCRRMDSAVIKYMKIRNHARLFSPYKIAARVIKVVKYQGRTKVK